MSILLLWNLLIVYSLICSLYLSTDQLASLRICRHLLTTFSHSLSSQLFSGIILNDLSDHLQVFVSTSTESSPVHANRNQHTITGVIIVKIIVTFRTHLTNVEWSSYSDNDPNIMYNNFLNEFLRIYDLSFPAIVIKRKKYKPLIPWITKVLLISTRKRNLYKQFMAKRNPIRESRYQNYKNKLTRLIKNAKHIMRKDLMQ